MARFDRDRSFERELRDEPQFQAFMESSTEKVADSVREAAPAHTGYYRRRVRAVGTRVRALDVFWHLVEFGSKNNPVYAPLRRGVLAAGLRLGDTTRK